MEKITALQTAEKVNELVIANPIQAVNAIDESVKALKTFDEKVAFIGQSAFLGRAQWVQTAIVTARAFEGLTSKEMRPKVEALQSKLNYGRSHVYNLRKAGEKLLAEAKAGTLKAVPFSLDEYIKPEKGEPINKQALNNVTRAGEYVTADNEKFLIYRGTLKTSDNKEVIKYFTVPAGGLLENGSNLSIQYEEIKKLDGTSTGKESECYYNGKTKVDVKIINL